MKKIIFIIGFAFIAAYSFGQQIGTLPLAGAPLSTDELVLWQPWKSSTTPSSHSFNWPLDSAKAYFIRAGVGGWLTTGNAATNTGTNFIGTTDTAGLRIKVAGSSVGHFYGANSAGRSGTENGLTIDRSAGTVFNPTPAYFLGDLNGNYLSIMPTTTSSQWLSNAGAIGITANNNNILLTAGGVGLGLNSTSKSCSFGVSGSSNVLNVDASTASVATGLNIKGAAAGGGLALSTTTSGANENITLDAKGAGTVTLNGTATGQVVLGGASVKVSSLGTGMVTAAAGVLSVASIPTGTVTSVAMTGDGTVFNSSVTGSPITSSGTLAPSLASHPSNLVFASPNGSTGAPTFRQVTTSDLASTTGTGSVVVLATAPTMTNPVVGTQSTNDNSTKAASTAYVTTAIANAVAGANPAVAVEAATTANISGYTYNNGVSGIGATLTQNSAAIVTIDGYTITATDVTNGSRFLFKDQTTASTRGVYIITTVGTGIIPAVFTRASDYNQPSDINNTGAIPVINGTVNATTSWLLTSYVATVGTDAFTYTQFTYAPSTIITTSTTAGGDLTGTYPNPTIKSSVALSGSPTTTTQSQGDNSTKIATDAYADSLTKLKFNTITGTSTTITDLKGTLVYDMDCTSNVDTLKLPAAATVSGNFFVTVRKKDSSVNKVVVLPNGSETINGQSSMVILYQNTSAVLFSNGSNKFYRQ